MTFLESVARLKALGFRECRCCGMQTFIADLIRVCSFNVCLRSSCAVPGPLLASAIETGESIPMLPQPQPTTNTEPKQDRALRRLDTLLQGEVDLLGYAPPLCQTRAGKAARRLVNRWYGLEHGWEGVELADETEALYVNRGDTYDETILWTDDDGFFLGSWGDAVEKAEKERYEESGELRCAYCGEWTGEYDHDSHCRDCWESHNDCALDAMTTAYAECALWSTATSDEEGNHTGNLDDEYGIEDIAKDTLWTMVQDCRSFYEENREILESDDCTASFERIGHDFWLTRNRHGSGFWDTPDYYGKGYEAGKKLSSSSHVYGSVDLWGDGEEVYS